ncbi:MAG TPA: hypothetical protein PLB89_00695 [Flavobacteriales bacterium]|nr:hypothetical protein [Flavobacteriales bacterium]
MTLIVGILCKDGVVVASDSAATFAATGRPTIGQQAIQKIIRVNEHVLFASTGAVGIGQVLADHMATLWKANQLGGQRTPPQVMNHLGQEINKVVFPYLQSAQMQHKLVGEAGQSLCKSLVAMPVGREACLFNFDFNGAPEQSTKDIPFIALGSGQPIADPFLAFLKRVLWPSREPTLAEGRLAAIWTINHVTRTNPGGVGGNIQLATLSSVVGGELAVQVATQEEITEHLQRVDTAEKALVKELEGSPSSAAATVPVPHGANGPNN